MDIQGFVFCFLIFFCGGIFILIKILTKFRNFNSHDSNKKLPPQPWKLPLIGHIHHLLAGGLPHEALSNIAKKLGPVVHLQLGQVSTVIISSPPLAKQIMKTHDICFANRPKLLSADIIAYNYMDIAFSPYGDYWRQMRKICVLELLNARKVQSFSSIREQESWDMVDSVYHKYAAAGTRVDVSDMIMNLINTIICRVTIGSRCKDQTTLVKLIQGIIYLSGGFDVCDLFPSVKFLPVITGTKSKMMKIRNELDVIFDGIIVEHQQRRDNAEDEEEQDLVDVLLRLKNDGCLEFPLRFDNIKAVILDMFVAGSDTSTATIEWVISELIKDPNVMKKAQQELRTVLQGKVKIHESDIQELNYLKLVIKETLRLHPPLPLLLPRECRVSCEIGGFHIPVKTKVITNMWMMGRDPDYWLEPEKFIPERFNDMTEIDFEYIPFGAGRRMCPGMILGSANVELPLAMLLYHFDWELPDGQTAEAFDMSASFGITLNRKNRLILVPRPYNANC